MVNVNVTVDSLRHSCTDQASATTEWTYVSSALYRPSIFFTNIITVATVAVDVQRSHQL